MYKPTKKLDKRANRAAALQELAAWADLAEMAARRAANESDRLFKAAEYARKVVRIIRGKK